MIASVPLTFPTPILSHFFPVSHSASVCSRVGRESVAAAFVHQMGHCQEVMRGKHLLLQRTALLHVQPFDTTYAGCTYKTKWPWRKQQSAMTYSYKCLALPCVLLNEGVMSSINHLYILLCVPMAVWRYANQTHDMTQTVWCYAKFTFATVNMHLRIWEWRLPWLHFKNECAWKSKL